MTLPKGLKHPGHGVPEPTPMVELAYASTKYERITRVIMTEQAARLWIAKIVNWPDVLRAIIRADDKILEDRPIDHRILSPELRTRCDRVLEKGPLTAYAYWSHK